MTFAWSRPSPRAGTLFRVAGAGRRRRNDGIAPSFTVLCFDRPAVPPWRLRNPRLRREPQSPPREQSNAKTWFLTGPPPSRGADIVNARVGGFRTAWSRPTADATALGCVCSPSTDDLPAVVLSGACLFLLRPLLLRLSCLFSASHQTRFGPARRRPCTPSHLRQGRRHAGHAGADTDLVSRPVQRDARRPARACVRTAAPIHLSAAVPSPRGPACSRSPCLPPRRGGCRRPPASRSRLDRAMLTLASSRHGRRAKNRVARAA